MNKVHVMDHPLIKHKITLLRKEETCSKDFRELVQEISLLMGYEVTRNLPIKEIPIKTPICDATGYTVDGKMLGIVPILRAGLGMVDGILKLVPGAKVGHIGCYRDEETHIPHEYYCKLPPDIEHREIIVLDPMLATGGSASMAINFIKERGAKSIKFVCLVAAPEGLEVLQKDHPDVEIYVGALDEKLNDNCYIVPGLGDAGDRLFGTK